jgi:tetratricopeptide (TPR) repeat protein
MMALLIVILVLPIVRQDQAAGPVAPVGPPAGGPSTTDLANMPPREAADRLFNRVMTAVAADNTAEWAQFLPMAIQSYDMARPLDQDGLFHLSMLHSQNQDPQAALAVAREGLETNPDHLLNLNAAAHAAAAAGDSAAATEYYQRFLDVFEAEQAKGLAEYQAHANMLPEMTAEAEAFLGG